jgi:hypothetical protein
MAAVWNGRPMNRSSYFREQQETFLHSSEVHTAPYAVGAVANAPGFKRPGRDDVHSPPSGDEVENVIVPLPSAFLWRVAYNTVRFYFLCDTRRAEISQHFQKSL